MGVSGRPSLSRTRGARCSAGRAGWRTPKRWAGRSRSCARSWRRRWRAFSWRARCAPPPANECPCIHSYPPRAASSCRVCLRPRDPCSRKLTRARGVGCRGRRCAPSRASAASRSVRRGAARLHGRRDGWHAATARAEDRDEALLFDCLDGDKSGHISGELWCARRRSEAATEGTSADAEFENFVAWQPEDANISILMERIRGAFIGECARIATRVGVDTVCPRRRNDAAVEVSGGGRQGRHKDDALAHAAPVRGAGREWRQGGVGVHTHARGRVAAVSHDPRWPAVAAGARGCP